MDIYSGWYWCFHRVCVDVRVDDNDWEQVNGEVNHSEGWDG